MQYFRIHAGTWNVFTDLIEHDYRDYTALVSVMGSYNSSFPDFTTLVTGYRLANLLNQSSGIYGYGGEASTFDFTIYPPSYGAVDDSFKLKAGGAIYLDATAEDLDSFQATGQGANIRYVKVYAE